MKPVFAAATVALTMIGSIASVAAQPYGGRDYGYEGRGYGGGYGFDEREYLRCNPDVRRAVRRGQMESGIVHYQVFGRYEGRRLSC